MARETGAPTSPLEPLGKVESIEDVIANLDKIIDWAIDAENGIGYFATAYKRVTVAIRDKIEAGNYFDDDERMTRFDTIFAQRYFDALNTYFHPLDYQAPTHAWQWCFNGVAYDPPDEPIMLQHMLTAVNAHVNLDLGISAMEAAKDRPLEDLKDDFDRINELLTLEITVFLDKLAPLSRRVRVIRRGLICEQAVLGQVMRIFRNLAWAFANQLGAQPQRGRNHIGTQDAWSSVLGSYYLHTNDTINGLVQWIGEAESRSVGYNLEVLDGRRAPD